MQNSIIVSDKSEKSLIKKSEMFTTRQIAEQLNTSSKVVLTNAKKCLKDKVFENGKTTYFTKEEVTLILEQMKSNQVKNKTFTRLVKATNTELTPALKIKQAMDMAMAAYEEELERIKAEKVQVETERDSLQIELDQSKDWYSIKRMEMLNPEMSFNWRLLKKKSEELGYDRKDVFDANYGEVKAYHRKVWESLYFDSIDY